MNLTEIRKTLRFIDDKTIYAGTPIEKSLYILKNLEKKRGLFLWHTSILAKHDMIIQCVYNPSGIR